MSASAELPRYKVADERAGVFLGDTPTQPVRKHRDAAAAGAPAPSPRFAGAPGLLTWLDSRWWQWDASQGAWRPIGRARGGMQWGPPLPLSGALDAFVRAQLAASGNEPLAQRLSDGALYLLAAERGGPALRAASSEPADLAELAPPPVPEVVEPFTDVRDSMRRCAEQIARDFRRRRVIEDARECIDRDVTGVRGRPDRRAIMWALFADQKRRTSFYDDPHDTEHIGSTEAILCLDKDGACLRGGDCDDQIVALGSRAMALGIAVRLRARRYANQRQLHVVLVFNASRHGAAAWEPIDPSTESGRASDAPYTEEIFQDVDTSPAFVGLGDPGGEEGAMLGQATATQVDPGIAAALVGLLGSVKQAFDASLSELVTVAADYAQLRTTLGLPATDAAPATAAGEAASGSPLGDYATSVDAGAPVWTPAALAAEQKLITTATFLSQAMADGLNGTRTLTYDPAGGPQGGRADLFIAAVDGNPYRVLLVKNQTTGVWTPQYLDPSTNAASTLGFPWTFVVGAVAVAVVSAATAWAVTHYMDKLRQEHQDDMLQKVTADAVASGATPDQVNARIAAIGQAGAAMNATAAASPVTDNLATIAKWLSIAGVAIAGIFVVRSLASLVPERKPRAASASHGTSVVRYRHPVDAMERGMRFRVLEVRGDRALIELMDSGLSIPPTESVALSELAPVRGPRAASSGRQLLTFRFPSLTSAGDFYAETPGDASIDRHVVDVRISAGEAARVRDLARAHGGREVAEAHADPVLVFEFGSASDAHEFASDVMDRTIDVRTGIRHRVVTVEAPRGELPTVRALAKRWGGQAV